jgi:hypothetical protein
VRLVPVREAPLAARAGPQRSLRRFLATRGQLRGGRGIQRGVMRRYCR